MLRPEFREAHTIPRKDLIHALEGAGKPIELCEFTDGSSLLLLPHGGRVLGLFAPHNPENFFWVNPALASADSARAFYAGSQWHNSGGDRTWLGPEADLFFPNFPNLNEYWQPRELDPGNYEVVRNGAAVQLVNRLSVNFSRRKERAEFVITKSVAPAPNPLRYEGALKDLSSAVEYAGYALQTTLEFISPSAPVQVGLWNLAQMPHGGDLLIPTYSRTQPKVYMGNIGPEDLVVSDRLIRYKMRAAGEHKIGVRAVAVTGRMGYIYPSGDRLSLMIRNFSVNPSGEYVDVPWKDTNDLGYSAQACNVNSQLGSFSEMEYHAPAIGKGTGRIQYTDSSQLWAFRGSPEDIRTVVRNLLSSEA